MVSPRAEKILLNMRCQSSTPARTCRQGDAGQRAAVCYDHSHSLRRKRASEIAPELRREIEVLLKTGVAPA